MYANRWRAMCLPHNVTLTDRSRSRGYGIGFRFARPANPAAAAERSGAPGAPRGAERDRGGRARRPAGAAGSASFPRPRAGAGGVAAGRAMVLPNAGGYPPSDAIARFAPPRPGPWTASPPRRDAHGPRRRARCPEPRTRGRCGLCRMRNRPRDAFPVSVRPQGQHGAALHAHVERVLV